MGWLKLWIERIIKAASLSCYIYAGINIIHLLGIYIFLLLFFVIQLITWVIFLIIGIALFGVWIKSNMPQALTTSVCIIILGNLILLATILCQPPPLLLVKVVIWLITTLLAFWTVLVARLSLGRSAKLVAFVFLICGVSRIIFELLFLWSGNPFWALSWYIAIALGFIALAFFFRSAEDVSKLELIEEEKYPRKDT